jgi:hypothetical protein
MAAPPTVTSIGYRTRIGVGIEDPYGTPVLTTQVLPSTSESLNDVYAEIPDDSLQGSPTQGTPEQGNFSASGDVVVPMRYLNEFVLLKHFFGLFDTGRYDLLDSLQGQGLTVAIDKQVAGVWEYKGSKATQVVWTSNADGVELQTSLIPGGLTLNATLNTHDHLVGLVQDAKRLLHHHLRLLMGTQDHALTFPADDLCVSELTLTLGRPMSEVYTNCSQSPLEPIEEDFLSLRLALTFPRFTSNEEQLLSWRQDYTRLQADLLYTHPTTGQTKRLVLPNLVLVTAQAPTTGPGARTLSVEASISRGDDVTTTTAATFAAADNSITLGTGTFPHLAPGAQLTVSGATTAGNNGTFKVVTWTATKVTLATPPTLVDEAAGASVSIATSNPIIYMTES